MHLLNNPNSLKFLSSEFDGIRFELFASDNIELINCIACFCEKEHDVLSNWKEIQSLISAYFQPSGKYAKWNIYLVIFCSEAISIREKYVIENDKYAVRKVVLDNLSQLPTLDQAGTHINKELLGSDLALVASAHIEPQTIDLTVTSLVSGAPMGATTAAKEQRSSMINKIIEHLNQHET